MSFDLPINVERELEQYALAEHLSPAEAAVKLIQSGIESSRGKVGRELTEEEWEILRNDPTVQFFSRLSDETFEAMVQASNELRGGGYTPLD